MGGVLMASFLVPRPKPASIAAPGASHSITVSTDHPAEEPISAYHSTAVGSEPKVLRLPTIQAEGYVQKVGVDQHRQVAVPTNIHLAGWFADMPVPGDPGLSIIDGHLDGRRQPGIFAHLDRLKPGDRFEVELASGAVRRFRVKTVQSLPTAQAAALLFSQTPGLDRQLNLITCGGTYRGAAGYDRRIIVTAQLAAKD
jgi:LPXTG-site transpeptidase (sortase) family protein